MAGRRRRRPGFFIVNEIEPGIFLVTQKGLLGSMQPPANIYVLAGRDGLVYDAGYGIKRLVRRLAWEIRRIESYCRGRGEFCSIKRVLPSHAHPDHFSGLAGLREELGLRIILTRNMAGIIRSRSEYRDSYRNEREEKASALVRIVRDRILRPAMSCFYEAAYGTRFIDNPDNIVDDDGIIETGGRTWRIIPSPGHSPDHVSLYDEGSGILLGGDNILRSVTTWLGPPKSDLKMYIRTLERIRALPHLRRILGAHGSPVDNPRERIDEIIKWRRQRLEQVYDVVVDSGGAGIDKHGVIGALYRNEGFMKRYMADGWIELSLRSLIHDGRIREISPGRFAAPLN